MTQYKIYEEEFKKTIVKLLESGKKASEYDLSIKNIYNWQKQYKTITESDGTVTSNK